MNIVLFSTLVRVSLAAAAVILGVATVVAVRRGHGGLGALLGVAALLSGGALAAEALIALTVRLAAPGATDFNEYRWVFLAPWGRPGLALGAAALAGIVALSWRARRGAHAWRRALMVGLRAGAAVTALVVFLEPAVELRQVAREPNRIAVLVDDSKSMALGEDPRGPSRIERARRLLATSGAALADWERDHKIDYYTFAETVSATTLAGLAKDPAQGK